MLQERRGRRKMPFGPEQSLNDVVPTLKSIAAAIDKRFVELGDRLTPAVGILERITSVFENLTACLTNENLDNATTDLTRAASQISGLAGSLKAQKSAIADLQRSIAAIHGNASRMRETATFVAVLAKNGKILAAGIDTQGVDFSVFTKDVDRIVDLARESLEGLSKDLADLDHQLNVANARHDEFDRHQADAINNISKWLGESVQSAASHGRQFREAAAAVRERSQDIGRKVGSTVAALQIGDATRQRVEHVQQALDLLSLRPSSKSDNSDRAQGTEGSLDDLERQYLCAEIWRLQAAQLTHTAQEFEREVSQIIFALNGLGKNAREILRLSSAACGGSDQQQTNFVKELEGNVSRALGLVQGVRAARNHTNQVSDSVLNAVMRCGEHVETVRTLEVDLRLLGLNMTFKCGRLGDAGRALGTIAQELRGCADRTTEDAHLVMEGLDSITQIADQMGGLHRASTSDDLDVVEKIMTESVGQFAVAGEHIAGALATLAQDGVAVASVLEGTASQINFQDDIGKILRKTAGELAQLVQSVSNTLAETPEAKRARDAMLAEIKSRYTMASERVIHRQIYGGLGDKELSGPVAHGSRASDPTAAMLDDVLF